MMWKAPWIFDAFVQWIAEVSAIHTPFSNAPKDRGRFNPQGGEI